MLVNCKNIPTTSHYSPLKKMQMMTLSGPKEKKKFQLNSPNKIKKSDLIQNAYLIYAAGSFLWNPVCDLMMSFTPSCLLSCEL